MHIQISQLAKSYGAFRALEDISLTIRQGMYGLLGPNGAGKTTLMRILSTALPATAGTVTIGDCRLGRDDPAIRAMLGYLPQEFGIYKQLTGYEYLDYAATMKGMTHSRRRKEAVETVLELVNMTDKAKERTGRYSGGMKQRIGIAAALLGSPKLVIVDEPTAGLDPEERLRLRSLLSGLSADRIVILSTHVVADIADACSELAVLKRGRLAYEGSRERLLDRVRGRVWTGCVAESRFEALKRELKLISARKAAYGHEIRVLSDDEPFEGAIPARIGLDDAYIDALQAEVSGG
ncbi:ATP-binding cassette domain-containing protein [Paenibacillus sp. GYB003]|uniref:ATP-binding cassette domain-containing protein n=1 Tax=Paenibacillus sp. GYB003 TaxID=2994392 RepID=UPI002F96671A